MKQINPRKKRQKRVRKKIKGTADRPRLNIFRSNKFIYAQLIDDLNHVTLVSASDKKEKKPGTISSATILGEKIAEKAKKVGIKRVVFDRAGYKYHGKVKALAESARQSGLKF